MLQSFNVQGESPDDVRRNSGRSVPQKQMDGLPGPKSQQDNVHLSTHSMVHSTEEQPQNHRVFAEKRPSQLQVLEEEPERDQAIQTRVPLHNAGNVDRSHNCARQHIGSQYVNHVPSGTQGLEHLFATSDDETTMAEAKIQTCTQAVSKPAKTSTKEQSLKGNKCNRSEDFDQKPLSPEIRKKHKSKNQPTFKKPNALCDVTNDCNRTQQDHQKKAGKPKKIARTVRKKQEDLYPHDDKENIDPNSKPLRGAARNLQQRPKKQNEVIATKSLKPSNAKKADEKAAGKENKGNNMDTHLQPTHEIAGKKEPFGVKHKLSKGEDMSFGRTVHWGKADKAEAETKEGDTEDDRVAQVISETRPANTKKLANRKPVKNGNANKTANVTDVGKKKKALGKKTAGNLKDTHQDEPAWLVHEVRSFADEIFTNIVWNCLFLTSVLVQVY